MIKRNQDSVMKINNIQDLDIALQWQSTNGIVWKIYKHTTGSFQIKNAKREVFLFQKI